MSRRRRARSWRAHEWCGLESNSTFCRVRGGLCAIAFNRNYPLSASDRAYQSWSIGWRSKRACASAMRLTSFWPDTSNHRNWFCHYIHHRLAPPHDIRCRKWDSCTQRNQSARSCDRHECRGHRLS